MAILVQSAFNVRAGRHSQDAGGRPEAGARPEPEGPTSSVSMNGAVASDTTRPTARPAATGCQATAKTDPLATLKTDPPGPREGVSR